MDSNESALLIPNAPLLVKSADAPAFGSMTVFPIVKTINSIPECYSRVFTRICACIDVKEYICGEKRRKSKQRQRDDERASETWRAIKGTVFHQRGAEGSSRGTREPLSRYFPSHRYSKRGVVAKIAASCISENVTAPRFVTRRVFLCKRPRNCYGRHADASSLWAYILLGVRSTVCVLVSLACFLPLRYTATHPC